MSWIVLGKFWACLVPEGLLDGQVMVISRRFDRPVTEWTFRQEPLPPTKNNERKNAQTFMSLPLSSPYSGFCSSVKRFHIVSSLTSENNIARRLNLPGFRRFPRSAKSFCCNFSQFHFISWCGICHLRPSFPAVPSSELESCIAGLDGLAQIQKAQIASSPWRNVKNLEQKPLERSPQA